MNWVEMLGIIGIGTLLGSLLTNWVSIIRQKNEERFKKTEWLRTNRLRAYGDFSGYLIRAILSEEGRKEWEKGKALDLAALCMMLADDQRLIAQLTKSIYKIDSHFLREEDDMEKDPMRILRDPMIGEVWYTIHRLRESILGEYDPKLLEKYESGEYLK